MEAHIKETEGISLNPNMRAAGNNVSAQKSKRRHDQYWRAINIMRDPNYYILVTSMYNISTITYIGINNNKSHII